MNIKYMLAFGVMLCCLCFSLPLQAATPEHELELHKLGILIGYDNYCIKFVGLKNHKDPEGGPFGDHYGAPYRDLGPKGPLIFREGVKKGVYSAASEKGQNCRDNLSKLIKMYKAIGLKGTLYQGALNKLAR